MVTHLLCSGFRAKGIKRKMSYPEAKFLFSVPVIPESESKENLFAVSKAGMLSIKYTTVVH